MYTQQKRINRLHKKETFRKTRTKGPPIPYLNQDALSSDEPFVGFWDDLSTIRKKHSDRDFPNMHKLDQKYYKILNPNLRLMKYRGLCSDVFETKEHTKETEI